MSTTHVTAEPGMPFVTVTREFDAPRDLVFRAYTDPELLVRWLGPRDLTMKVEEYDARHGGRWRYVSSDADGNEYGFHGVFHGDPSPDSLVQTFEFEGVPGHVSLDSATFDEQDGKTVVTTNTAFQSVADRDGMVASGMEGGMRESFDRLDELLTTLRPDPAGKSDEPAGTSDDPAG